MKSLVFKTAWKLKEQFSSWSECVKHCWKIIKLRFKMATSYVSFKYRKVDGSIREAVGTLNFTYESKGGKSSPVDSLVYLDQGANAIRSCKLVNIL